jgi:hypothetical protein
MRNNQQNCATWRGAAVYRTNKQLISWPRIALPVCRECRHSTAVAEDAAVQNKGIIKSAASVRRLFRIAISGAFFRQRCET